MKAIKDPIRESYGMSYSARFTDEFKKNDMYDDEIFADDEIEMETQCPNCLEEYDDIDYEYQICHICKYDNS